MPTLELSSRTEGNASSKSKGSTWSVSDTFMKKRHLPEISKVDPFCSGQPTLESVIACDGLHLVYEISVEFDSIKDNILSDAGVAKCVHEEVHRLSAALALVLQSEADLLDRGSVISYTLVGLFLPAYLCRRAKAAWVPRAPRIVDILRRTLPSRDSRR